MTDINTELARIQQELKAVKESKNDFGGYQYRSAEQILGALKKVLGECAIVLSDEMVEVGGRVYVKATALLTQGEVGIHATAYAREAESRKGMDDSQLTGSTSSYARKYALCGLFGIDDNKDADTNEFADAAKVDGLIDDVKEKARAMLDAVIAQNVVFNANMQSVIMIKDALAEEDYSTAKEAWKELGTEAQDALWVATSKGGIFSTKERNQIQSTEFRTANGGE